MKANDLAELNAAGISWTLERALADALSREIVPNIRGLDALPHAQLLKRSLQRTVHRVELAGGPAVIVKEYRLRNWRQRLKRRLFGPKPCIEWAASRRLLAMGVPASHAIAVGLPVPASREVEGYLVVEAPPDAVGMGAYLRQLASPSAEAAAHAHEGFLRELARFVRRLHDRGVRHHDLHWGNILVRGAAASPDDRFLVIDLHRIAIGAPPSPRHRALAIAQLLLSIGWPLTLNAPTRTAAFLDAYQAAGSPILSPQLSQQQILAAMDRHAARRLRSRARRCLKESSAFTVESFQGWRICRRRDRPAADILALWAAHKQASPPDHVSRLPQAQGSLELREFPSRSPLARLFRASPAVIAYAAAHRSWLEGGGGPQAIAAAECLRGPDKGRSFALLDPGAP